MNRALPLLAAVVFACGPQEAGVDTQPDPTTTGDAPLLGSNGQDAAERACHLVLRSAQVAWNGPGPVLDCSSGKCFWVVTGAVDVSETAVAEGAQPWVLYRHIDSSTWSKVQAQAAAGAPGGFKRFTFSISRGGLEDGLSAGALSRTRLELIPYLLTTSGARLFDHNRLAGDFDVYEVTQANGWKVGEAPAVCPGAQPAPVSNLQFHGFFRQTQHGALVAGGSVVLDYDITRLATCRGTHNGHPAWDVRANVRFQPSGTIVEGTVRGFDAPGGTPSNAGAISVPLEVKIPSGSTSAEVWFVNSTGAGSSCVAYDSNFGANYVYPVAAQALPAVGWAGNAQVSLTRNCRADVDLPDTIWLNSYIRERACSFVDVSVWVPGVTDAANANGDFIHAKAELELDGVKLADQWLSWVGPMGNDARFRFDVPRGTLYYGSKWETFNYTFKFSTDGRTWVSHPKRTVRRDVTWCNPAWGGC